MKLINILLAIVLLFSFVNFNSTTAQTTQGFVIDHTSVELFDQIPEEYFNVAEQIKIVFMDRSVGSNISDGLTCLASPTWALSPSHCRRDYIDSSLTTWKTYTSADTYIPEDILFPGGNSRTNIEYLYNSSTWEDDVKSFISLYPSYLNKDIFTYQHNYLHVSLGSTIDDYFFDENYVGYNIVDLLNLENQYPEKTFIYWTSSLARVIGTPDSQSFNDQMRSWATSNGKVLFDVADIESHNPDGSLCTYNGYENICRRYTTEISGGHLGSVSAGKIRIAKAFWVLLARLSGWNPNGNIPTETPTAIPTATSTELPTPTVEPTQIGPIQPYLDSPECIHDPLVFHELWDYNLGCHYDHHHGDYPHDVDYIFGTEFLNSTGGDIKINWQPTPTSDLDFRRKHYGLFWMVRDHTNDGIGCYSRETDACILAFRAETHALSDLYDIIRFNADGTLSGTMHVFKIEALVCLESNPTDCGIVRFGGRQYLGDANYATSDINGNLDIRNIFDVLEPRDLWGTNTPRPQSLHSTINFGNQTWYPVQERGLIRIATHFNDAWSYIDPTDPMRLNFDSIRNQSSIKPEIIGISLPVWFLSLVEVVDNKINWRGYVDITGYPTLECLGTYCPPVSFENVPIGQYQYNGESREYDIPFDDNVHPAPSGWIIYPGLP